VPAAIPEGKTLVIADASIGLPFKNKTVDFLIASHVAEHVDNPALFIQELTRISHRGYIETPGILSDIFLNEPFHPWRVCRSGNVLVFRRKRFFRPLSTLFYRIFYYDQTRPGHITEPFDIAIVDRTARRLRGFLNGKWSRIPGTYMIFSWENRVNLKVIE